MAECPNCDKDTFPSDWPDEDEVFACPECGCEGTVQSDYPTIGTWVFWVVETEEWLAKQKQDGESRQLSETVKKLLED